MKKYLFLMLLLVGTSFSQVVCDGGVPLNHCSVGARITKVAFVHADVNQAEKKPYIVIEIEGSTDVFNYFPNSKLGATMDQLKNFLALALAAQSEGAVVHFDYYKQLEFSPGYYYNFIIGLGVVK